MSELLESLVRELDERGRQFRDSEGRNEDAGVALVVSCSMARHGHHGSLWPIDPAWTVRTVETPGNETRDHHDSERAVSGPVAQVVRKHDVDALLVVGHTACSVVEDAYERYRGFGEPAPAGVAARLDPLVTTVEDAVDAGFVDDVTFQQTARYRLVEYNVVRQVSFLTERVAPSVTVAGYVYDQDGAYSPFPGKHYLVTVDGETDESAVRDRLSDAGVCSVERLCD